MIMLHQPAVKPKRIKPLNNNLVFCKYGKRESFASRTADISKLTAPAVSGTVLSEIGAFSLYECNGNLYCLYNGAYRIIACISSTENSKIDAQTVKWLENYLISAYKLDPYTVSTRLAFEKFDQLVSDASDFCGCLTDTVHESNENLTLPFFTSCSPNVNCEHIALAILIIALMYRRISALRGFNFKVTLKDSMLCLIFSAKVLFQNEVSPPDLADIREYSALKDIIGNNRLIIGARIRETDDIEECGAIIHKLSVIICPQTVDPRGILRSSVWKQHVQTIIDGIDIEIEGKY